MKRWILFDDFPFHSLPEAVPKQFMDIPDRTCSDKLILRLSGHRIVDGLCLQELDVVLFQNPGRYVFQLHAAKKR